MRSARIGRLGESPATASTLPSSGVFARGDDARVVRRVSEAGACFSIVPGITGVIGTGARFFLDF